mmetsp:Transcript_24508/g.36727  ORF Transcript_24508/g.36727 Transcript_24508/m.36727 type:complete len:488 (-) Transcript_24508:159-1622(-)
MAERADVIIIGAGMAGISAGYALREGRPDLRITILEGRFRVGGRIHTVTMDEGGPNETEIDLGAAWLQSPDQNPLAPLLQDVKKYDTPISSNAVFVEHQGVNIAGERLSQHEVDTLNETAHEWIANAIKLYGEDEELQDDAATSNVIELLPQLTQSNIMVANRHDRLTAMLLRATMENYLASSIEQVAGFGLDDASFARDPQSLLQDGFGIAIDRMSKHLDVRVNNVVTRIQALGEDLGVLITTQSGILYWAQKVIVTVPLGVLKIGSVEFIPPLPSRKLEAISRIGFGVVDKVVLRFPHVFWNEDRHFITYLTSDRSLVNVFLNMAASMKRGNQENHEGGENLSGHHHLGGVPILVGFHSGIFATDNEYLSDEKLVEKAMVPLRNMHGNDIPEPVEVYTTRWGLDPMSLGSYSAPHVVRNLRIAGVEEDIDPFAELSEPIGTSIYFAGESTSRESGFVHGAFTSGYRAASEVQMDGIDAIEKIRPV